MNTFKNFFPQQRKVFQVLLPKIRQLKDDSKKQLSKNKGVIKNPTKQELQWRIPRSDNPNEFYSKFKLFEPDTTDRASILKFVQTPIDLRPSTIKKWFIRKKQEAMEYDQKFNPIRLQVIGSDLGAAYFIVHRGGRVKFFNKPEWIEHNDDNEYNLPLKYDSNYIIEAIDCKKMVMINYDGLENMKGLRQIKAFSVNSCKYIDDWCIDRISGQYFESLEELDLRNCPNVTFRGLEALYKFNKLKVLKIDKPESKSNDMVCLLLEELFPKLKIEYNIVKTTT